MWTLVHNTNAAQGFYYGFMHIWTQVFGRSPVALRLPSALAVGVATVGVAALARTQLDRRTSLLAGAVFAVLPRISWAGIEARPYALTAAVAVWLSYAAVRGSRSSRIGWWVLYGLLAGVGVGLYVYLALLVVAHGLVLLVVRRVAWRTRFGWLSGAVAAAVIASPVLLLSSGQTSQLGIGSRLGFPTLVREFGITEWFLGDTPTPVTAALRPLSHTALTTVWTGCAIVLALLGWALAVRGALRPIAPAGDRIDLRMWLIPWIVLPAVVIGLYSVVVAPMYVPRYLTFAAPALAILIAQGLRARLPDPASTARHRGTPREIRETRSSVLARRWRPATVAVLVAGVVLTAPIYYSQRTEYAKNSTDWSGVAAYVGAHKGPDSAVYFGPRHASKGTGDTGSTLRQIAVCYPSSFAGLRDLTLVSTGAQDGSLIGRSLPLAAATDRLAGVQTVWVLRRRDAPAAEATTENSVLIAAGFAGRRVWRGPGDDVWRYQAGE